MVEKWRLELEREAINARGLALGRFQREYKEKTRDAYKTLELKLRIIDTLRTEPESVFGDTSVFVRTEDHLLVHDVAKALNVKLDRTADDNGFQFAAEVGNISVRVYGVQNVPHCRIVPKIVRKSITVYTAICNGDADAFTDPKINRIGSQ